MDAEALKIALDGFTLMMALAAGIYSWAMARDKATATEIKTLHSDLEAAKGRIQVLETQFEHMPDKEQVHRMEVGIEQMRGDMKAMSKAMESVSRTSIRLEEFLIEQSKPRTRSRS